MFRYLFITRLFWSASFAAEMEYRANFLLAAVTSLLHLAASVFSLSLLFRGDYRPGGWPWEQALLVLGMATTLEGVSMTWLTPNLGRIVKQVQDGTLDFVLLKPVDSQFWLSTRNISPWGLPNLFFGVALVLYAGARAQVGLTGYLAGLLPVALGLVILYCMWFVLGATSIWFVKVYNVTEVLRSLLDAGKYPISAFPFAHRLFFTFIVPVAFLTTVPAEAMLGRLQAWSLALAALLATLLFALSRAFWRFALRYYTSASS